MYPNPPMCCLGDDSTRCWSKSPWRHPPKIMQFFPLLVVWKSYMRDDIIVEDFQMQRYQAGIVKEASCLFIIFQSVRKHYAGSLLWKGASTVLLICKHCKLPYHSARQGIPSSAVVTWLVCVWGEGTGNPPSSGCIWIPFPIKKFMPCATDLVNNSFPQRS